MSAHRIVRYESGQIDRVERLWKEMVAHHRRVIDGEFPVRSEAEAWEKRRADYVEFLGAGARMLAAVPADDPDGEPLGYAVLSVGPGGASWDLSERVGEIESLSVAAAARGQGIGSALIEACRELLREEGVEYWSVAVVEVNDGATRLYERSGFRPFYRNLLGRVEDEGSGA